MSLLQHLADTVADLMRADPRRVLLGEDVREGGMLGLSRVCAEDDALRERLLPTPLVPTAAIGHAAGLALAGLRPIVLLPGAGALLEGLPALREAARTARRSSGARGVPLLLVAPTGPGFGLGGEAGEAVESVLCNVPGLRTACVGRAIDAGPWLRATARFEAGDDPTVLLLPRTLVLAEADADALTDDLGRAPTAAHTTRPGARATVFAWGATVDLALQAVTASGVDAAVVDVGSLAPLDVDALVDAATATGKIVIAHAGPPHNAVGAELAALFAKEAILQLDAPVLRVSGADAPRGPRDEHAALPTVSSIADAIAEVAAY